MRRDVYERIRTMNKDETKPNYAGLARAYGCDYRTAKRYCEGAEPPGPERKRIPSKLDPYKALIAEKLKLCCTYSSIYYLIRKRGYAGKYTILRNYCRQFSGEQEKEATVRFETCPGLQSQVDWKEKMTLRSRGGTDFTINIFLTLLGYSRLKYIELTLDRSQDTLFRCLVNSFRYFGGVPEEIVFDNMRAVVGRSRPTYEEAVINQPFYQFSRDMGFKAWTCRAFRPQTKGKVENLAKIMERLRPFDREFDTLAELDGIVRRLNADLNREVSQATGEQPAERHAKEKEYLRPLPSEDIISSYTEPESIRRIVSRESLVTYRSRKYSVSPRYIGKTVTLTVSGDTLEIYYNREVIKSHRLTSRRYNYAEEDYVAVLRGGAMKNSPDEDIRRVASDNLSLYDRL